MACHDILTWTVELAHFRIGLQSCFFKRSETQVRPAEVAAICKACAKVFTERGKGIKLPLLFCGEPYIIAIQECQPLPVRLTDSLRSCCRDTLIFLLNCYYARSVVIANRLRGAVAGTVIHDDNLVYRYCLRQHTVNRAEDKRPTVIRRNDRRYFQGISV